MEVEDVEVRKAAADERGGQDAPVAAAADRQRAPGGDGELPKLAARLELEAVRGVRDAADPLRDARRVVLARVVTELEVGEDVVGPGCAAVDRERWRAVRDRPLPGGALDRLDALLDVGPELVARLLVDADVRESMRGRLVAPCDDLAHEVRIVRHGHPEQEEGRAG